MKRKIILYLSAALIFVEIGVGCAIVGSGQRQLTDSFANIVDLVRELSHPIPRFGALP